MKRLVVAIAIFWPALVSAQPVAAGPQNAAPLFGVPAQQGSSTNPFTNISFTGQALGPDNCTTAPAYALTSAPTNGWGGTSTSICGVVGGTARTTTTSTAFTSTVPHLNADGSASAPSYSFTSAPTNGLFYNSGPALARAGTEAFNIGATYAALLNTYPLGFSATNVASIDLALFREAAGHLFQRNSTNAQRWSVPNTYTSSTNYEAFSVDWQTTANVARVGTRTAATGTGRAMQLVSQGNSAIDAYSMIQLRTSLPVFTQGWLTAAAANVSDNATGTWFSYGNVTHTASSGSTVNTEFVPTINQSGTAGFTGVRVNATLTGTGSGTKNLIDVGAGGGSFVERWSVNTTGTETTTQTTIESTVQQLVTTATNDDPTEKVFQGRVATTDATPTTINTITIPTSTSTLIECRVVNRRTGGSSGSAEDSAGYYVWVVVKNTAGTVAEIAAETTTTVGESIAGYNVTAAPSGATELIQVTGAATTNITWHSTCRSYGVNQ